MQLKCFNGRNVSPLLTRFEAASCLQFAATCLQFAARLRQTPGSQPGMGLKPFNRRRFSSAFVSGISLGAPVSAA
jgi:hypothetical protein